MLNEDEDLEQYNMWSSEVLEAQNEARKEKAGYGNKHEITQEELNSMCKEGCTDFHSCYFSHIKFEGTYTDANFENCYFYECEFQNAEFINASFKNVTLSSTDTQNVNFLQTSFDSFDWKDYGVDSIVNTVINHKHLGSGSIILCHNGAKFTKDALESLIKGLQEKGFTIVPISELIYKDNYEMDHEGRQFQKK